MFLPGQNLPWTDNLSEQILKFMNVYYTECSDIMEGHIVIIIIIHTTSEYLSITTQ